VTLADTITKGRATAVKVAVAYAAYKKGVETVKQGADRFAHEWRIEEGYADSLYRAALRVAAECQTPTPGSRQRLVTGDTYYEEGEARFNAKDWTLLKGIAPGVQARKPPGSSIEFRAFRMKDMDALQEYVEAVEAKMQEEVTDFEFDFEPMRSTSIFSWDGTNGWQYTKDRASRTFNSVLIPSDLQQEIEADLERFTKSRERLTRLEMPWRRGYLLEGPPGTGKTSLSLAIAGALGFNLATLSLTDIKSDGMLKKAVSTLRPRTVLVIEDIDANSVSHERDHNNSQDGALSLSGLLNSLDGFETPEGLVTILTTNHIEKLDAALTRSGRMDRTFTLDCIAGPELVRLFEWFYEQPAPGLPLEADRALADHARLAPAEAAELFKQHLDDPEGGWRAVLDRINTSLRVAA
jgi:hypothetical protein